MITTTLGDMDESLLVKTEGTESYPDGDVHWIEYRKDGEIVHRSVNVALKGREITFSQEQLG